MKKIALFFALLSGSAFAYQVTGPVLELTDSKIVVQKGKEKWELAREPGLNLPEGLKVGDKVTVQYSMTATDVEAKSTSKTKKK